MRRTTSLAAAAAAAIVVLAAMPASAAVEAGTPATHSVAAAAGSSGGGEWIPVPSAPFDQAAGVTCDFPIHGEPLVDEVVRMVIKTYPDGSPKQEMYTGALIFRVTNTLTGASVDVDISGTGVMEYKPGSSFGRPGSSALVYGPILLGMHEGLGNLPRGLYVPNGVYTLTINKSGFRTITWKIDGGARNICEEL